eukprot:Hpha_TRINITY_DN16228_c0_g1::TRINITY_DN16228_c0_g1_i1::g.12777::m.12777
MGSCNSQPSAPSPAAAPRPRSTPPQAEGRAPEKVGPSVPAEAAPTQPSPSSREVSPESPVPGREVTQPCGLVVDPLLPVRSPPEPSPQGPRPPPLPQSKYFDQVTSPSKVQRVADTVLDKIPRVTSAGNQSFPGHSPKPRRKHLTVLESPSTNRSDGTGEGMWT